MVRTRENRRLAWRGGSIAGAWGGLALVVWNLLASAATGQNVWPGLKFASLPFLGKEVLNPGFALWPVLVGTATHFAVSVGWGVLFALLFFGLSRYATVAFGFFWGLVVWIAMFFFVLPIMGAGTIARAMNPIPVILEHLVFGLVVALAFLPHQRPADAAKAGARAPLGR